MLLPVDGVAATSLEDTATKVVAADRVLVPFEVVQTVAALAVGLGTLLLGESRDFWVVVRAPFGEETVSHPFDLDEAAIANALAHYRTGMLTGGSTHAESPE